MDNKIPSMPSSSSGYESLATKNDQSYAGSVKGAETSIIAANTDKGAKGKGKLATFAGRLVSPFKATKAVFNGIVHKAGPNTVGKPLAGLVAVVAAAVTFIGESAVRTGLVIHRTAAMNKARMAVAHTANALPRALQSPQQFKDNFKTQLEKLSTDAKGLENALTTIDDHNDNVAHLAKLKEDIRDLRTQSSDAKTLLARDELGNIIEGESLDELGKEVTVKTLGGTRSKETREKIALLEQERAKLKKVIVKQVNSIAEFKSSQEKIKLEKIKAINTEAEAKVQELNDSPLQEGAIKTALRKIFRVNRADRKIMKAEAANEAEMTHLQRLSNDTLTPAATFGTPGEDEEQTYL